MNSGEEQCAREDALPQGARKQVTVLFVDLVDYTARSVACDPEDLADDIRVFQNLCEQVAEKYHGHVNSYLGDGLLILFGHPNANEFAPEQAVRAAMEMVEQMQHNNAHANWRGREVMRVRIGIATGLVVVGERAGSARDRDELVFGETTNLAARLQDIAAPDSVVTALRTRRLVGGAFKFRELGEHELKGFAQKISAWQIVNARTPDRATAFRRTTTRFVGRESELRRLREYHARAQTGDCRIIHLNGDAGIGKSRLLRAFERTIHKPDAHRLRVTCSPYFRGSAFRPIVDETHRWLQISRHDSVEIRRAAIRRAMYAIGRVGGIEHLLFNDLLNIPADRKIKISAEEKHRRTVIALADFVIRLSRLRPLLLVVEDLHWADGSTLQVLSEIVARAEGEKLFAVFTSRSEFVMPWRKTKWLTEITLGGLDVATSRDLISAVSGADALPPSVAARLVQKSDGVPLFLEETSRHLIETMDEQHNDDAQNKICETATDYNAFAIPDTLQDSLNARLDQLGDAKNFAQLAAVFGSDFNFTLIKKVAAKNDIDADAGMDVLMGKDLLLTLPGMVNADEDRYQFSHALFKDAAYHSLLKKTRRRHHLQIAETLLEENPNIEKQHPELIAYHYSNTEHIAHAVLLWRAAGERAIAQSAMQESLQHLTQGLQLISQVPEDAFSAQCAANELALQLNLGVALTALAGYHGTRVTDTYQRALALAEQGDDAAQECTALYGLWRCFVSQAAFAKAVRVMVKLKVLSEVHHAHHPEFMMTAFGLQGMTRMVAGKISRAENYYDRAVQLYQQCACEHSSDEMFNRGLGVRFGQDPYVTVRGLGAVNKLLLNKVSQSRTEIKHSIAAARATDHAYTVAETLRVAAMYSQIAGDFTQLRKLAEETVALSSAHHFDGLRAAGKIFLGFCFVAASSDGACAAPEKIRHAESIERNLERYADNYGKLFLPYFHGVLAEAYFAMNDFERAMQAAHGALVMVEEFGEHWWRAPLLAIKSQAAEVGGLANANEIKIWRLDAAQVAAKQRAEFIRAKLKQWTTRQSTANAACNNSRV